MTMTFPDRREASPASRPRARAWHASDPPLLLDRTSIAGRAAAQPDPPGLWLHPEQLIPAVLPDRLPLAFGGTLPTAADFPADRLTTNMATMPSMPTRWLWGCTGPLDNGRVVQVIPRDELTVIAAKGGTGKGFLMNLIIACVTGGSEFPFMPAGSADEPGDVIVVMPEDNPITALGPRLDSAGADRRRVHDLTLLPSGEPFSLPSSMGILYKAAKCFPNLKAIIIDPIAACVDVQMTSVYAARATLGPLVLMAQELGIAIIMTVHLTKDGKVHGSPAVVDTPRYVWMIDRDEQNDKFRRMIFHKGNNIEGAGSLQYTIRDDGFGPRAVFVDRDSLRAQRMQPMMQAAIEYQQQNRQRDGAYTITDARHPALPRGEGAGVALDRAAAALAGRVGPGWAAASDSDRDRYRAAARAMLAAS